MLGRMGREGVVMDYGMSASGWRWAMFGKT